jgi:hypothetical protein
VADTRKRLLARGWAFVPAASGPPGGGLLKLGHRSTTAALAMTLAAFALRALLLSGFVAGGLAEVLGEERGELLHCRADVLLLVVQVDVAGALDPVQLLSTAKLWSPACRSAEIMRPPRPPSARCMASTGEPAHCRSILRTCPSLSAALAPAPAPREYEAPCAGRPAPAGRTAGRQARPPAPAGPPRARGFPQAGDLFDPGLRAIRGLASTAAHTQDRPVPARPAGLPET